MIAILFTSSNFATKFFSLIGSQCPWEFAAELPFENIIYEFCVNNLQQNFCKKLPTRYSLLNMISLH